MDELLPPLSSLDEDAIEEIMQHNMCNIEGSTDNAEQIAGHDDNDVPRHGEDAAVEHEDEVDMVAASGDRGPEGEKEEHVRLCSSFVS
jgi:hypothetical protein